MTMLDSTGPGRPMGDPSHAVHELDAYWDNVVAGSVPRSEGVDPSLAAAVRHLHALDTAPAADPAFRARLWQELTAAPPAATAVEPSPPRSSWRALPTWIGRPCGQAVLRFRSAVGIAAAASLVLAIATGSLVVSQPPTASASEIVERAQAVSELYAPAGISSMVQTTRVIHRVPAGGGAQVQELRVETRQWYAAPNRLRDESTHTRVGPDGAELDRRAVVLVSNGTEARHYDPRANLVLVLPAVPKGPPELGAVFGVTEGVSDLPTLLKEASTCYAPKLAGEETVAGRAAFVLDLGTSRCTPELMVGPAVTVVAGGQTVSAPAGSASHPPPPPGTAAPDLITVGANGTGPGVAGPVTVELAPNAVGDVTVALKPAGPRKLWVDKQYFNVLRSVEYSATDGGVVDTLEVTSIQYDVPIDPSRFTLATPSDARVVELQPPTAPAGGPGEPFERLVPVAQPSPGSGQTAPQTRPAVPRNPAGQPATGGTRPAPPQPTPGR